MKNTPTTLLHNSLSLLMLGMASLLAFSLVGCGNGVTPSSNGHTFPIAQVTTLAGSGNAALVDGAGAAASFSNPVNLAINATGDLVVCDYDNDALRAVTASGNVTTLTQFAPGSRPFGIIFAPDGSLYVQTDANDLGQRDATTGTIWKVDTTTGTPVVVARNLGRPRGMAALPDGRLVLANLTGSTVLLLDPTNGNVTTLAGTDGQPGSAEGHGAQARFNRPYGVAIMPDGSILLADQGNNCLRRVTLAGDVTTFAGIPPGSNDGTRAQARFFYPQDVAIDNDGVIYVADNGNHRIRRIDTDDTVTTIVGTGVSGYADGAGVTAQFFGQEGIAVTPGGNTLYVADGNSGDGGPYNRIRKVTLR